MDLYPTTPLHYKGRGRVDVPSALCVNTYFYSSRTVCGIRHRAGGLCLDVGTQMQRPDFTTRRNVCVCTLSVCLSVCLCLPVSVCLFPLIFSPLRSVCLCTSLSIGLSVSLFLSVCLSFSAVLFCLFVCFLFCFFFSFSLSFHLFL